MNQGKIWLVVKPTVGIPMFLGGVALISLAVHTAVLTHTAWYPAFYNGKAAVAAAMPKTASVTPAPVATANAPTVVAKASTDKP